MIQRVQRVRVDEDRKVWVDLLVAALAVAGSAGAATMSVSNLFNPIVARTYLHLQSLWLQWASTGTWTD